MEAQWICDRSNLRCAGYMVDLFEDDERKGQTESP